MTTKISKIDRHQCVEIRKAINDAVAPLAERLGVSIHAGNGTYDDFECSFKIVIAVEGDGAERMRFEQYCGMFYLPADAYGQTFKAGGRTFTLVGLKPNRPKYPICGSDPTNGKQYKFQEKVISHLQEGKPGQPEIKQFVPRPAGFQGSVGR